MQTYLSKQIRKDLNDGDFDIIVFVDEDRFWQADWKEVKGLTSVCLASDKGDYKPRDKDYDPNIWRLNH